MIIEIKYTINAMHLNHPQTTTSLPSLGKNCLPQKGCAKKVGDRCKKSQSNKHIYEKVPNVINQEERVKPNVSFCSPYPPTKAQHTNCGLTCGLIPDVGVF